MAEPPRLVPVSFRAACAFIAAHRIVTRRVLTLLAAALTEPGAWCS